MVMLSAYKCKKDMYSIFNCKNTISSSPKNCIQKFITQSDICQHIFPQKRNKLSSKTSAYYFRYTKTQ